MKSKQPIGGQAVIEGGNDAAWSGLFCNCCQRTLRPNNSKIVKKEPVRSLAD